jgi:hypothetical protein
MKDALKGFNFKEDWATTLTGIILLVVTVLAGFGLLTPEQSTGVQTQAGVIMTAISQIVAAIGALVLMFTKKTE